MRICVTLLTFWLLVIAANGAPANTGFTNGTIQRSCAPWDGPAIGITLSDKPLQCGKTAGRPFIGMGVWRGLPIQSGQSVKFASISDVGFASRCKKDNDCERAESAEITFDTYKEGSSASGRYELHFKGGDTVSGDFDVKWCEFRQMCG